MKNKVTFKYEDDMLSLVASTYSGQGDMYERLCLMTYTEEGEVFEELSSDIGHVSQNDYSFLVKRGSCAAYIVEDLVKLGLVEDANSSACSGDSWYDLYQYNG